jgi:hypothetical protein
MQNKETHSASICDGAAILLKVTFLSFENFRYCRCGNLRCDDYARGDSPSCAYRRLSFEMYSGLVSHLGMSNDVAWGMFLGKCRSGDTLSLYQLSIDGRQGIYRY